jgi:rhodanese-related sulfurtransferase
MVSDLSRGEAPWFVLTGDMLFVGSVGRPDLGGARAAEDAWESLQRVLLPLDDSVEVYPAHGAGSACGRAMSAKSGSTIGFERRFNAALQIRDRQAFVEFLMRDLPPKPPSFEKIVGKNKGLISLVAAKPRPFTAREAWDAVQRGAIVLAPLLLLAQGPSDLDRAVQALARVGVDEISGFLQWGMIEWRSEGFPVETVPQITVSELAEWLEQGRDVAVIDVREHSEWIDGHIEGALHLPMLEAAARRAEVPADRPKAVLCAGGLRSSTAISALKRHGLQGWYNVTGGMTAWKRGYPVVRSSSDPGTTPRA